jgi:hypothetical protein
MTIKIAIAVLRNVFSRLSKALKTINATTIAATRMIKLVGMALPEGRI